MALTDAERRVLGHLPRYRTSEEHTKAEKHMREVNAYPKDWKLPKSVSVEDHTARVAEDQFNDFTEDSIDEVQAVLEDLAERGLAKQYANGEWAMTLDGLDALMEV